MSKSRKKREKILLSDSLGDKIENYKNESEPVYKPVKSSESTMTDLFDTMEEELYEASTGQTSNHKNNNKFFVLIISISIILLSAFVAFMYMYLK